MLHYSNITVDCRLTPGTKNTFRVYFSLIDGSWIPLPVDICDNGCNAKCCLECAVAVFKQAQSLKPPFAR